MLKDKCMKVLYTSPIFKNVDGKPLTSMIPAEALATYVKRDKALVRMIDLGGIYAPATPEFMKLRATMMSAKRKITRMGWFSTAVAAPL